MLTDKKLSGRGHFGCRICQNLDTFSVRPIMYHVAHEVDVGLLGLRREEIMDGKSNATILNSLWTFVVPSLCSQSALSLSHRI